MRYTHEPAPDSDQHVLLCEGDAIGFVADLDSAETLLSYLEAGAGGFRIETFADEVVGNPDHAQRMWVFVDHDDTWVAYTDSDTSADAILSHLNRLS
jgi:hypothetical protein